VVDTIDIGRGTLIFGGGTEDNLLGTTLQVLGSRFVGEESTGTFTDIVDTSFTPWDFGRVHLGIDTDLLAIDFDTFIPFLDFKANFQMS